MGQCPVLLFCCHRGTVFTEKKNDNEIIKGKKYHHRDSEITEKKINSGVKNDL
jgi:hypothetical protein